MRSRQKQLEADLANAWSRDPLVLLQSGVHQRDTETSGQTTQGESMVPGVGVEPLGGLILRNLLILRNDKMEKTAKTPE